jgi:hypothetical protein
MRPLLLAALGLVVAGSTLGASAWAENPPIQAAPLPPLQRQWQQENSRSVQQAPFLPGGSGQGAAGQAVPSQAVPSQAVPSQAGPGQLPGQAVPGQAGPGQLSGQAVPGQAGPGQLPGQAVPGQAGPAPDLQGQGQTPPTAPPVTPPATVERHYTWVPAGAAKLQALDKVNAQASDLTIKVGQSATFGSLTIMVKSCMIRPSDQPADAAAFLNVTDSHPDSPGFDGWLLEDEPSVSMMQHPIYDLRVTGCA